MLDDLERNGIFELVERDAWLDFFAAAPDDCAQALGISSLRLSHMGLLASREVAMVEFSRAMCVGIVAPATETELEDASSWLTTNAATGWALQVAPTAHTGSFKIGCGAVGWGASERAGRSLSAETRLHLIWQHQKFRSES